MVCSKRLSHILFHFPPVTRFWSRPKPHALQPPHQSPSGGTHRCSRGLMGSVVPPAWHESASGSPLNWTRVEHLPRETSRGIPTLGRVSSLPYLSSAVLRRKLISAARIHAPPGHARSHTPHRAEKLHYFKHKPLKIQTCHPLDGFVHTFSGS